MKTLVLGKHRSRSNWFLDIVSSHYNLTNFYEPYRPIYIKHLDPRRNEWWNDRNKKNIIPEFINDIKTCTDMLSYSDGISLKLEITHLTMFPYAGQLVNFDLFNWHMYDKIYITHRTNLIDTICSLTVAHTYDKWLYEGANKPFDHLDSIKFDQSVFAHQDSLFTAIWDDYVLELVYDYLIANHIPYSSISYENMIKYTDDNFPKGTSRYISSNYEYKNIISNYSDIEKIMSEYKPKVLKLFDEKNI